MLIGIALYVSTMGDQGSGSITGGRYSIDALIRGGYQNNPDSATQYSYPTYDTTATTKADALSSITTSTSLLNAPAAALTRNSGRKGERSAGLSVNGTGDYRNETLITNPRDVSFLTNLVQTIFYLRGIEVVPPEYAEKGSHPIMFTFRYRYEGQPESEVREIKEKSIFIGE